MFVQGVVEQTAQQTAGDQLTQAHRQHEKGNGSGQPVGIGQHEGHEQRDVEHGGERELTRAGVLDGERRLEVGR